MWITDFQFTYIRPPSKKKNDASEALCILTAWKWNTGEVFCCSFFVSLNNVLPSTFLVSSCVLLLFAVTIMARPIKATWIPWSGVYSYIPGTWSTWWRKGQSYTKQSETEQTGLISCYFQGNWPGGFSMALYLHIWPDSWRVGGGININLLFPFPLIWSCWGGKKKKLSLRSPLYGGVSCQDGTGTLYPPQPLFMHRTSPSSTKLFLTAFLGTYKSTVIPHHRALFCSSTLLGRRSVSSWRAGVQSNFRLGFSNATERLMWARPHWARWMLQNIV